VNLSSLEGHKRRNREKGGKKAFPEGEEKRKTLSWLRETEHGEGAVPSSRFAKPRKGVLLLNCTKEEKGRPARNRGKFRLTHKKELANEEEGKKSAVFLRENTKNSLLTQSRRRGNLFSPEGGERGRLYLMKRNRRGQRVEGEAA